MTFDDITELQSAQRKAAWADVARRIAHEIKNPLTPIQLSAERLKRRFAKEITSDPDTFWPMRRHDRAGMWATSAAWWTSSRPSRGCRSRCIRPEDIGRVAREALILQKTARPEIDWRDATSPSTGRWRRAIAGCSRQAVTNLLQNAADAVAMRQGERPSRGRIASRLPPPAARRASR